MKKFSRFKEKKCLKFFNNFSIDFFEEKDEKNFLKKKKL